MVALLLMALTSNYVTELDTIAEGCEDGQLFRKTVTNMRCLLSMKKAYMARGGQSY